ncbi:class E sortase [Streptomyces sp. NBC_01571]|uniref:class E sortase n=1 Tax=Streptomyces sp. NBC_01571 TaxID=2975883 RepID=UPI002259ACD8|nr:class E sortase [Streptomyces sp. NBC_01571]MCX4576235.1 class E sortase [Streptomyces sp. NBC_01571]
MTALRPERESGAAYGAAGGDGSSYGQQPYGAPGAFEGAIEQLADPLTDPLPGTAPAPGRTPPVHTAPGHAVPAAPTAGPQAGPGQQWPGHHQYAGDGSAGYARDWQGAAQGGYDGARQRQPYAEPATTAMPAFQESAPPYGASTAPPPYTPPPTPSAPVYGASTASSGPVPGPGYGGVPPTAARPLDDETVALRASEVSEARLMAAPKTRTDAADDSAAVPGGRAARRKAARRHGRHGGPPESLESQTPQEGAQEASGAPLSRVAARRAAQARKPGAAVVVSRMVGEVFITTGVLMLLFVTYQLWWSNVRAHQQAGSAAHHLQEDWASGKRSPGTFEPGQGFAILHIPKLDVVAPIAEGTSKTKVLDRGMVGHYGEGSLKTAMPDAKTGNFGLAGHRNTHGEPFRYINRLKPGDAIVVETQDDYFVYKMASILPVTSPSNTSVLAPVPKGSGFTGPGRYITLTTCTPEFTSKYRMIVWGKMVEERPRSKGKPDALIG